MNHFFISDQKYCEQCDGVATDSPLGPRLANAFICHFREHPVKKLSDLV